MVDVFLGSTDWEPMTRGSFRCFPLEVLQKLVTSASDDGGQDEQMLVVLPPQLAASHLRQCWRYLSAIEEDAIGLLYAAETAHMALHTLLVDVKYRTVGSDIMWDEGKEIYPGGPKKGGKTRSFKELVDGLPEDENTTQSIMLLNDVRDRLQHPMPGPMGYVGPDLISGIEAAVRITMRLWEEPCYGEYAARCEALAASHAILSLCSILRSHWISGDALSN